MMVKKWLPLTITMTVILSTITLTNAQSNGQQCPSKCTCIWKNNKLTAQCVNQGLISIPSGIAPSTQVLDLNKNNFQILPNKVFQERGLNNLQKIYLAECKLGVIAPDAFTQLTNLIELYLSSNLLTSIPSDALKNSPSVRRLLLNNNPIQAIRAYSFFSLSSLYYLDLSECQIETVDKMAFTGLDKLQFLKLEGNRLTTLTSSIIKELPPLYTLDLHKNPWNCDCELRPIIDWMSRNHIPQSVPPTCHSPDKLSGSMWNSLRIDDFACLPMILSRENELNTAHSINMTYTCTVKAVPTAKVSWQIANIGHGNSTYSELFNVNDKYLITEENPEFGVTILTLNILNVDTIDAKFSFRCLAENEAGTALKVFNLTVAPNASFPSLNNWTKMEVIGAILGVLLSIIFTCVLLAFCFIRKTRKITETGKRTRQDEQKTQQNKDANLKLSTDKKLNGGYQANSIVMDEKLKSDSGSSSTYGYKPDITVNGSINGEPDQSYLNSYTGLLQVSPNSQYPYSSSHLQALPSIHHQLEQRTLSNDNIDAYSPSHQSNSHSHHQHQSSPPPSSQMIPYVHYDQFDYSNQGPNYVYEAAAYEQEVGLLPASSIEANMMLDSTSIASYWSKQQELQQALDEQQDQQQQLQQQSYHQQQQQQQPQQQQLDANQHHVNVIGQGSYNIGQPTVVRYSPDEGYAEEPAVIPYNLQGTEV